MTHPTNQHHSKTTKRTWAQAKKLHTRAQEHDPQTTSTTYRARKFNSLLKTNYDKWGVSPKPTPHERLKLYQQWLNQDYKTQKTQRISQIIQNAQQKTTNVSTLETTPNFQILEALTATCRQFNITPQQLTQQAQNLQNLQVHFKNTFTN
jgi:hypothetical protein